MAEVLEAVVKLKNEASAGLREIDRDIKNTSQQMEAMGSASGEASGGLMALETSAKAVRGAFAASAAVAAAFYGTLGSLTSSLLSAADALADMSAKSGVGTEALQAWGYAAELSGVSAEKVASMMTNLSARVEQGGKQVKAGLDAVGLGLQSMRNASPEEEFRAVIKALGEMTDAGQQAAAAKEIFGAGWKDALTLVRDGAVETADSAKALGLVLDGELVASAARMADTTATLTKQWEAMKLQFVASVAESKEVQAFLAELVRLMGDLIPLAASAGSAVIKFAQSFNFLPNENQLRGVQMLMGAMKTVGMQTGAVAKPDFSRNSIAADSGGWIGPLQKLQEEHKKTSTTAKALESDLEKLTKAARLSITLDKGTADNLPAVLKARQQAESEYGRQLLADLQAQNEARKDSAKQVEENGKAFMDSLREQEQAEQEAIRQSLEHREALLGVADALSSLGDAVGGAFGSMLSLGAGAVTVFANLNKEFRDSLSMTQKIGGSIQGAAQAYGSGSVMGGAMAGASAGAMFGPIGAGVGAVAGGILGFFGGKAKIKKELADLRAHSSRSVGGSMDELRKKAAALGVDISKAFTTKNPEELKRIMDQLSKAAEEQKKRWEGVQTALGGLELRVGGFAASMGNASEALAKDEDTFQRLGRYAVATFGAYVRETGDVIGALLAMEGSLGNLADLQAKFGFTGGAAITELLRMREVLTTNKGVADSLQGLNQLMKGLADQGGITKALFQDFGADAGSIYQQLIAGGADANTAMALMQPTLQQLWEAQKKYGAVTDETTAALLKQAEEQGLVGENMMSVNEQILSVLVAIGEALGAQLPAALRRFGSAAETEFGRAGDAAERFSGRVPDIGPGGRDSGNFGTPPEPGGSVPGFAVGGTVRRPTLAVVGERGTEHILTPSQLQGYMAAAMQAAGTGGGQVIVKVYIDGREITARVEKGMERGEIAPARGRLKVRG